MSRKSLILIGWVFIIIGTIDFFVNDSQELHKFFVSLGIGGVFLIISSINKVEK